MSTKNLARTVIEGGRSGLSKGLRRRSSRYLRMDNRRFCEKIRTDLLNWGDKIIPLRRRHWDDIEHKDRTNPCDRFLISRAGRHWNDVHSEICSKFDRRKLAGMHVTNDHLLNQVHKPDDPYFYMYFHTGSPRFWVDEHGIFHHNPKSRY